MGFHQSANRWWIQRWYGWQIGVHRVTASPQKIYRFDISTDTPAQTADAPHGPVEVDTLAVTPDGSQVFSSRGQVWSGDLSTQLGSFSPSGDEIEYSDAHNRFYVTAGTQVVEFDADLRLPLRFHDLASSGGVARVSSDVLYVSTDLGSEAPRGSP